MNNDILLSICIPTFNRCDYVKECITNALKIPGDDVEFIVCDNCSTDNTENVVKSFNDPRLRYFRNSVNIGAANFIQAMLMSRGEWCFLLSDEDDIICSDWDKVKSVLRNSEDFAMFRMNAKAAGVFLPPEIYKRNSASIYQYALNQTNYISGVVFKLSILRDVWQNIKKSGTMWEIYPHVWTALYLVQFGNLYTIPEVEISHSRNAPSTFVSKNKEPYMGRRSRFREAEEKIRFIMERPLDKNGKLICVRNCVHNFLHSYAYWAGFISNLRKSNGFKPQYLCDYSDWTDADWKKMFLKDWKHLSTFARDMYKQTEDDYFKIPYSKETIKKFYGNLIAKLNTMQP